MEDDLRLGIVERHLQPRKIGQIGAGIRRKRCANTGGFKQTGLGRRIERIAMYRGAEPMQPKRQPAALEAGVASDQDALAGIESTENGLGRNNAHQIFQGATPEAQNSSS
jgi:hypothetical protein